MGEPLLLPIVDVTGSRYEAGKQLGKQVGSLLHEMVALLRQEVDRTHTGWESFCRMTKIYSAFVENFLPKDYEEMVGVQEGSGLPLNELFALTCLELREELEETKGCTDFVIGPEGTSTRHVYACHNEDWNASERRFLVIRRSHINNEPESISVGYGGLIPSIGFNRNGLAVTGNALSPNDKTFGVPKLHIVREILASEHLHDALTVSSMQPRASSFNNVLTSREGQIFNFEGSAQTEAITTSSTYSVHTNHYLNDQMRCREQSSDVIGSMLRYHTMDRLVSGKYGAIDVETCKELMGNHTHSPSSPCRHESETSAASCTVFAAIIDLTDSIMHVTSGNPCCGKWQVVGFE